MVLEPKTLPVEEMLFRFVMLDSGSQAFGQGGGGGEDGVWEVPGYYLHVARFPRVKELTLFLGKYKTIIFKNSKTLPRLRTKV